MRSRILSISEAIVVTLIKPEVQKEAFLSSHWLQMPMTTSFRAWHSRLCISFHSGEAHSVPSWPPSFRFARKHKEEGYGGKEK